MLIINQPTGVGTCFQKGPAEIPLHFKLVLSTGPQPILLYYILECHICHQRPAYICKNDIRTSLCSKKVFCQQQIFGKVALLYLKVSIHIVCIVFISVHFFVNIHFLFIKLMLAEHHTVKRKYRKIQPVSGITLIAIREIIFYAILW